MSKKQTQLSIATPFSHLCANAIVRNTILQASDLFEIRQLGQAKYCDTKALWHCELSIVSNWNENERSHFVEMIEEVQVEDLRLPVVSFHAPSCYVDNIIEDGKFFGQGSAMSPSEMFRNSQRNAAFARSVLSDSGFATTQLLVENNNHLGTAAYDTVTDASFIKKLIEVISGGLLLDISHARISAINTAMSEADYFNDLPLDRCSQVHICRHGMRDGFAFDAHERLEAEDWDHFTTMVKRLPKLEYVTIEYYKDSDLLLQQLSEVKTVLGMA